MDKKEKYLSITDAAAMLGKSRQTIYDWIKAGRFPTHITMGKTTFIPVSDVEQVKTEEARKHIEALAQLGVEVKQ